jgi:hypothetical protein
MPAQGFVPLGNNIYTNIRSVEPSLYSARKSLHSHLTFRYAGVQASDGFIEASPG